MKRLLLAAFATLCFLPIHAQKMYDYKGYKIDAEVLVKNLRHNAQDYVEYKGWGQSKRNAFFKAYDMYLSAIQAGRISTTDSGALQDSAGLLNNGSPIWYDKKGTAYTQEQYERLSNKQKKSCLSFYPNREVAKYVDIVVKELYKTLINK